MKMCKSEKSVRTKKVTKAYRVRTAGLYRKTYHITPKIILEGNYLSDAGFKPEDTIKVTLQKGRIVVTNG